jgi:hypothetical protein
MKRLVPLLAIITAILAISPSVPGSSPATQDTALERFDEARLAWDTGDFLKALDGFEALLNGPDGERFFDRIALITGELYKTIEVSADGRTIRVSPDGKYVAFESGDRTAALTRIAALSDPRKVVAEVKAANFVFSPMPDMGAYLRVKPTPEIAALRKEIEQASAQPAPDRVAQMARQRTLARLEAKAAEIVAIDLAARKERVFKADGYLKGPLAWSADGREVYFVGARETDEDTNEIYAASEKGSVRALTSGAGFKTNPISVRGGKFLLFTTVPTTPFPRQQAAPQAPATGQAPAPAAKPQGQAQPGGGRGGFGGGMGRPFVVLNLADGTSKSFTGSFPSISADGSTLVFVAPDGQGSTLNVLKLEGALVPSVIKKSAERIVSASPSPDGKFVVFDTSYTRNTEIFIIGSDGKAETRLSREIQPDRAPRFLNADRVLAVKGEPRHSRAYVYDVKTLSSFRLFDNNTLRTIAPEYEWTADPSGTKVLIGAERDGDTISPERGVYVVDLTGKVTREDLLARLRSCRTAETALRAKGERMFAPIRDSVRAAVDRISITKLFDHEAALFDFDSKYITMPGNAKAIEYITGQLKSFGYEPEIQAFETRGTKMANVLATLRGTEDPEIIYVLSGHFDSNQRSPGADDNTSVTAVNLETARVLARKPLPGTVIFAFFTGEEAGLYGSREFVRQAVEKKWRIAADLNNDMIGWTDDHKLDDTIRYANPGIRDIQHAAAFLFSRLITHDTRYVRSTDAQSFYDAYGDIIGGLGSYPVLGNPYYHQPTDLLETVNHQLLTEAAKYNTAAIMMLASSPMPVKDLKIANLKSGAAEAAWAPSPEKGVASYTVTFGPETAPEAGAVTVKEPRAALAGFQLKKGESLVVSVRAVTDRGIESWDSARASSSLK